MGSYFQPHWSTYWFKFYLECPEVILVTSGAVFLIVNLGTYINQDSLEFEWEVLFNTSRLIIFPHSTVVLLGGITNFVHLGGIFAQIIVNGKEQHGYPCCIGRVKFVPDLADLFSSHCCSPA